MGKLKRSLLSFAFSRIVLVGSLIALAVFLFPRIRDRIVKFLKNLNEKARENVRKVTGTTGDFEEFAAPGGFVLPRDFGLKDESGKRPPLSANPDFVIQSILFQNGVCEFSARVWNAVSRHETGNFTSDLYALDNNLFGMKMPSIRDTLAVGISERPSAAINRFAKFRTKEDAAFDILLWMKEFGMPKCFEFVFEQVEWMKSKGYFEEPLDEYLSGVEARLNQVAVFTESELTLVGPPESGFDPFGDF